MNLDFNDQNILLLLKMIPENKIVGSIKFQHLIYFIQSDFYRQYKDTEKEKENFNYSFVRWNYGPSSRDISNTIAYLESRKFIYVSNQINSNNCYKVYSLTYEGSRTISELTKNQEKNQIFEYWIKKLNSLTQENVIRFSYKKLKISNYEMGDRILLFNQII